MVSKPVAVALLEKIKETPRVSSFRFTLEGISASPGQFFMVWIPGVDEIPMSISGMEPATGMFQISVAAVGDATRQLCEKNVGDLIGIRGPYGKGFTVDPVPGKACVIGGGVGMASINPLVDILSSKCKRFVLVNAGRTEQELLFHQRFEKILSLGDTYLVSTDDGSCGDRCFGHEVFNGMLARGETFDKVFTCGPELMMAGVHATCKQHGIALEASLERMMRCGNGLCGLCGLDPSGLLTCKDGPVFSGHDLDGIEEFGRYHRDFSGCKIPFLK